MNDLKSTYNRIAEDWHNDHHEDTWWHEATKKFISFLKPGDLILDVGCGAGHKTKFLIDNGLKVVGTDLSEKMIEIAKREVPDADYKVMDMREVKNIDNGFDGIFAHACLLHIPKNETQQVMKTLSSRLKNNGYFYVAVKELREGQKAEEIVRENDYGYEYERFFSFYTLDEIISCFENLNMKIIFKDIVFSGKTNWIQVIAQK